jgi:hypothetical protein
MTLAAVAAGSHITGYQKRMSKIEGLVSSHIRNESLRMFAELTSGPVGKHFK